MAFCTSCGADVGDAQFCTACGAALSVAGGSSASSGAPATTSVQSGQHNLTAGGRQHYAPPPPASIRKPNYGAIWGGIAGGIVIALILVFASATHWTKIDVAEHKETFHSEQYLTGDYEVVDSGVPPCWVGQDWTDCINAHVDTYNSACPGVSLTTSAKSLCDRYLNMIEEMKAEDGAWSYVSTLGSWGYLTRTPEQATRQVSNNDYRPEVSHAAVCYLGFMGECPTR